MPNDNQQISAKARSTNPLDDPRTALRLELYRLFRAASAQGRVLYPDQAMQEVRKSISKWQGPPQAEKPLSAQENKTAAKIWRDVYYTAVDYHFDFYYALADRGGRPKKEAEFLKTEELKASGLSNNALAKLLGISRGAVLKRRSKVKKMLLPRATR